MAIDNDPFLLSWDIGDRISGKIPYEAKDVYLVDTAHESGFEPFVDNSLSPFYGGRIKLEDNLIFPVRIDLRKYKTKLTSVKAFVRPMIEYFTISYIKKGEFKEIFLDTWNSAPSNPGEWKEVFLPEPTDVTWLVLKAKTASDFPSELEIYGSYIAPTPITKSVRKPAYDKMTWVNAFQWNVLVNANQINPDAINALKQHAGMRHYLDRRHLEPSRNEYYFAPSYNGAGSWNMDQMYIGLKEAGIDVRVCIKNSPDWLQETWPENLRSSEQLPVDYQGDKASTIAWAMNPEAYLDEAKLFWQFTARYGSVEVPLDQLSVHQEPNGVFPHNEKKTGLNLVNKIEVTNEPDSWWHGWKGFSTAHQLAARMSCIYDGHMNTMGPGVGVKLLDPNMDVSFPGIANANIEIYKSVIDWCREHRGYKADGSVNVPFDTLNYHQYSNDGGSVQNGGNTTRGMSPEPSGYGDKMQVFLDFTDEYLNGMPVVLGEYGYDIAEYSDQSAIALKDVKRDSNGFPLFKDKFGVEIPNKPDGSPNDSDGKYYQVLLGADKTLRKFRQAQWMLRTSFIGWMRGLHELQVYMLNDASDDEYGHYAQGGLLDETTPRPSGNFFYQSLQILRGFYFDSLISANPYVMKGVNENNDAVFILWSPTEQDLEVNYELSIPNEIDSVEVKELSLYNRSPITENKQVSNGKVTLKVTETPMFVGLSRDPILQPVENFQIFKQFKVV